MWLFLVTEVLFFSGLFVAYAIYRSMHPEVFISASEYLNTTLGAINTIVLLLSSLTMAWGVRCAQLGQSRYLALCLTITLACAGFFLGVKAVEYSHKGHEGLLWAGAFNAAEHHEAAHSTDWFRVAGMVPGLLLLVVPIGLLPWCRGDKASRTRSFAGAILLTGAAYFVGFVMAEGVMSLSAAQSADASHAATGESHSVTRYVAAESTAAEPAAEVSHADRIGVFFSIYFAMTGVHAIHILAGMGVIAWLLWRCLGNEFGPQYFGPVDFVGLYWHLVDLVWIYLFPLLYLIG
jgi:cytochrome c oxidase subunit 3